MNFTVGKFEITAKINNCALKTYIKTVRFGRKNARSIATDECIDILTMYKNTAPQMRSCQTADKKLFSPAGGE